MMRDDETRTEYYARIDRYDRWLAHYDPVCDDDAGANDEGWME